jgi:hypothetical protein
VPRGSKPGERRGGRKKGTPNKATAEIKDIARIYGPNAVQALAIMSGLAKADKSLPDVRLAESEQARVGAIKEILDRGYGKAAQPLTGEDGGPIGIEHLISAIDGKTRRLPSEGN